MPMELGDPGEVSLDGLSVTVVEDSSVRPIGRDLRDARERAQGALASAGARVRTVSLPDWRFATLPFLAALQDTEGEDGSVAALLRERGGAVERPALAAVRAGCAHSRDEADAAGRVAAQRGGDSREAAGTGPRAGRRARRRDR